MQQALSEVHSLLTANSQSLGSTPAPPLDGDTAGDVMAALAAGEELARCHSVDALLRRAVELARDRLGLEQVSLYLIDEANGIMRGTWGTSPKGQLVDERHVEHSFGRLEREAHRRAEAGVGRWLYAGKLELARPGERAAALGNSQVLTPVRSLRSAIGVLYNKGGSTPALQTAQQQVPAAVFACLLGGLIESLGQPLPRVPQPGAKYAALVRKAVAALNEDPTATAHELARQLEVSSTLLRRAFQAELSVSLVHYRNRLRLERFFRLVADQGGSFVGSARAAGFGSYAQFHRIFRQSTGVAPREYLTSRATAWRAAGASVAAAPITRSEV
jgi:AraC-like DNA-binding protein